MTHPTTDPWVDRLSEYVDGELDASTRDALEAHLPTCAECRATRDALVRVVARAKHVRDREPTKDLWTPIESAIAAQRDVQLPVGSRRRVFTFSASRLTAAAAAVAIAAGGLSWFVATNRTTTVASRTPDSVLTAPVATATAPALAIASYRDAAADLERALEAGRATLRPETMRVIEENLRAIDIAIAQADSALRRDPGSAYLNQYLAATMQRKLKLLRRAVEITSTRS